MVVDEIADAFGQIEWEVREKSEHGTDEDFLKCHEYKIIRTHARRQLLEDHRRDNDGEGDNDGAAAEARNHRIRHGRQQQEESRHPPHGDDD